MIIKEEFIIPSGKGKMFLVKKGQILRIIEVEGVQAADVIIFNEHDMRESYSAWLTREYSGCFTKAKKLYSKLPAENIMFTVLTDMDGIFWLSPGRCRRAGYELAHGIKNHSNCQDLLAELIKPYGMTPYDVPEVLGLFMNASFTENGTIEHTASSVKKGDYVDLLAEMDCIVGVVACPDDCSAYNDFKAKPLGIKILEE